MALVKTRIKQKFATLTQWKTVWETFKPLDGEIIVFNITSTAELAETPYAGRPASELPLTITKTGTGGKTLAKLPWDVHKHDHDVSFTYAPEGTVSAPKVTIDPSTKSINTITSTGSLPEFEAIRFDAGSYTAATYTKGTWANGSYTAPDYTEPVYTAPTLKKGTENASNIWSDAVYTSATQKLSIGQSSFNAGNYIPGSYTKGSLTFPTYTEPTYVPASHTAPSLSGGQFDPGTLPTIGTETVVIDIPDENISVTNPTFTGTTKSFDLSTSEEA